jgi:hypothetical protein
MFAEAPALQSKCTKIFGHRTFEGKGDAFLRKRHQVNTRSLNPQYSSRNHEGPIPMHEGDASKELICINHRFGSSGLNLAYEGLLLGMKSEGHKDTPTTKLYLTLQTFASITTITTFITCFCRKGGFHSMTKL